MIRILSFIRHEPVFTISALTAAVSCIFVPPDDKYITYIDFRTLALLYSLMIVIAGLQKAGIFKKSARTLCAHAKSIRRVGIMLTGLCFFSSMLITNDVALLTFVPFSIVVLRMTDCRQELISIIVLQTVAANLGSMLTPMGNPQNLYLYSFYNIPFCDFLTVTFPIWLISIILILGICFFLPDSPLHKFSNQTIELDTHSLFIYLGLFFICTLTVIRILNWPVMLFIIIVVLLIFDRKTLYKADFMLLLTFIAFFIFAGNLARIDLIHELLKTLISGREYAASLLASQVISNVPAALLLSGFTSDATELLLGVNVGGLGTPIASLASLISLKLYLGTEHAHLGKFLLTFTAVNLVLLIFLSMFHMAFR